MINWTDKPEIGDEKIWNGFIKNGTVELRKTFNNHPDYAQILIVIKDKNNATLSMNGKASLSPGDLIEIGSITQEVLDI